MTIFTIGYPQIVPKVTMKFSRCSGVEMKEKIKHVQVLMLVHTVQKIL